MISSDLPFISLILSLLCLSYCLIYLEDLVNPKACLFSNSLLLFYDSFSHHFEHFKLHILKSVLDHTSSNYLGVNSTFLGSVDSLLSEILYVFYNFCL